MKRTAREEYEVAALTEAQVYEALSNYIDPYLESNLVDAECIESVSISDSQVEVAIQLNYPSEYLHTGVEQMLKVALENIDGCDSAKVSIGWDVAPNKSQNSIESLLNVKNVVAISSAKGGVGKSTTSVNLAIALAKDGAKVGLLDADIYGPSLAIMLGVEEGTRPETVDGKWFVPLESQGIKTMSMAYLVTESTPMVWRGPMVSGALMQIMSQTLWGELDYLLIDMPPGTGDIQLTLSQKFPISGALIVTTPQEVALADAQKGIEMFNKVNIPVLGMLENMSMHVCSNCGHAEHIFGEGGAEALAKEYGTRLLGSLPLSKHIREQSDAGVPVVAFDEMSEVSMLYRHSARHLAVALATSAKLNKAVPNFEVSDD